MLIDQYFENEVNIKNEFKININAYNKFKEIRSLKLVDYLDAGIKSYYKSEEDKIEETLFFYPFIGLLNELAIELANMPK